MKSNGIYLSQNEMNMIMDIMLKVVSKSCKNYDRKKAQKVINLYNNNIVKKIEYDFQSLCAKSDNGGQKSDFTRENDSAIQNKSEIICKVCNDECDCHMFVGGSGKDCPECREDKLNEQEKVK